MVGFVLTFDRYAYLFTYSAAVTHYQCNRSMLPVGTRTGNNDEQTMSMNNLCRMSANDKFILNFLPTYLYHDHDEYIK